MKLFQYILIPSVWLAGMLAACNDDHIPEGPEETDTEVSYPNRYYIDPENGAYYNTGHSPSQAWESVERFVEKTWQPGDTILIKRGTVWNGTIELKGSGEPGKPIVLGSYGDEDLPLPEINGEGKKDQTILIRNVQYWEIQDLKITNTGEEIAPRRAGIQITADNIPGGIMNHIHIKRCIIAEVNGSKTHHNGGGVGIGYFNVIENDNPSCFNDLVVEDCQIINCQRDGLTGYLTTGDRSKRKANTNVVFRGNLFEGVPGDQIIINGCDGAIVENNVIRKCAPGDFAPDWLEGFKAEAAAAVWCIHSDETVFRYNIVQDHKATWDGQAFDCDQNCMNTLFEYNITYNNDGGFFLLCPADYYFNNGFAESVGTIVRYNISINDGVRDYLKEDGTRLASTVDVVGRVVDFHFYNNTIIKTQSAEKMQTIVPLHSIV
ncbi:MAG: right-handed parallel beta-helix repeat-containing protein [Tannerellaceae bacterium]|nr:right-handed parallel beta-helix repeat-containing protein [Tannerellaceae bacterium]